MHIKECLHFTFACLCIQYSVRTSFPEHWPAEMRTTRWKCTSAISVRNDKFEKLSFNENTSNATVYLNTKYIFIVRCVCGFLDVVHPINAPPNWKTHMRTFRIAHFFQWALVTNPKCANQWFTTIWRFTSSRFHSNDLRMQWFHLRARNGIGGNGRRMNDKEDFWFAQIFTNNTGMLVGGGIR